jgi:hypothetical protein
MTAKAKMRIGFLFNHDQVHQVAHGLPVALALAALDTGAEILVFATNDRVAEEIRRLAGDAAGRDFELVRLGLRRGSSRTLDRLAGKLIPSAKLLVYRDNLDVFRSLDVLVVPEKTSLVLKTRYGLDRLKIVHTRHGAGDRAIGFDAASARFDHILASGAKVRDRLVNEAGVAPERISVVGYPKFDLFEAAARARTDERPTVVYNPHVAPHLSSWHSHGQDILRWFAKHPEYRLIFAPHIMLFQRPVTVTVQPPRIARTGVVPEEARKAENILIDTGSRALTTMDYMNQADIYLGDASSQIYEFLRTPRPAIFFDAHGAEWKQDPNYAHWQAGSVIRNVDALGEALASATVEHESRYRTVQEEMLRYTFDIGEVPSSVRAAEAIARVAELQPRRRKRRTASAARADGLPERSPSVAAARSS